MVLKGTEKVNGRDAYVIESTAAAGPAKMCFDMQSGLLLRMDSEHEIAGNKTTVEEYYDDYRDVNGVKMPFAYRQKNSQYDYTIKYDEIKHNADIADVKFTKPAS